MNWRAYDDMDSMYRRWPSAWIVSKARDDFPDPESPVITMKAFFGRSIETFFRLFTRAPLIEMLCNEFFGGMSAARLTKNGRRGKPRGRPS